MRQSLCCLLVAAFCLVMQNGNVQAADVDWDEIRAKHAQIRKNLQTRSATSTGRSSRKSPLREEYEARVAEQSQRQDAEKAARNTSPSRAEFARAGDPAKWFAEFLKVAAAAKRPDQLKPFIRQGVWDGCRRELDRYDPALAKRKLAEVAGGDDKDAELVRRIHQHPTERFLESHRRIAETIKKVDNLRQDDHDKRVVKMTGWIYPPGSPESLGSLWKLYPYATVSLRLQGGRWQYVGYESSIGVRTFR